MSQSSDEMRPARLWRQMPLESGCGGRRLLDRRTGRARAGRSRGPHRAADQVPSQERAGAAGREEGQAPGDLAQVSDLLAARLLVAYHLQHQRPMMGAFLDELGIAHDDGLIKDESPKAPDADEARRGGDGAGGRVSEGRRVALFLDAAVAGPRDVGRPAGTARTEPLTRAPRRITGRGPLRAAHLHLLQPARAGHPRGCCDPDAGDALQKAFKKALAERGLTRRMRANKSGCLDQCEHGPTVVVYPDAVWYGGVTEADIDEIIDRTSSAASRSSGCAWRMPA